jgi:prepilin-type processing-associated H-X9-DG protein
MKAKELKVGDEFRFPNGRSNYALVDGHLHCSMVEKAQPHRMMRIEGERDDGGLPYVVLSPPEAKGGVTYMGPEAEVEMTS